MRSRSGGSEAADGVGLIWLPGTSRQLSGWCSMVKNRADRKFLSGVRRKGRGHHGFDRGRVDQGVVDQARLDCPQDACLMLRI